MSVRLQTEGAPSAVIESALLARLREPLDLGRVTQASIALDVRDADAWTLYLEDGRVRLAFGADPKADTTISTDAATAIAMLEGRMSGIEAFIENKLAVRGNLALSLRVSGSLQRPIQRERWPRAYDVRAGGVDTFVLEAGDGPPVIAIHGLGATNASMLPTMFELASDHRVIAPDMPGFGDSGKPLRSYSAGYYARWAIDLLDELGIEKAHFVGNSLGGRVSVEVALQAPERVDKLVLFTPSPAFIRRREWARIVRVLRPELALVPLPLAHRRVVASIKALFSRSKRLPDEWYESAADEFLRVFSTIRGRISFFSAARQIYLEEPYGDDGFWERLCGLSRPALFIWGENDLLVPAKFAKHVEKALPQARSVVLEDCGHVPQFELPERTHELVREFLGT